MEVCQLSRNQRRNPVQIKLDASNLAHTNGSSQVMISTAMLEAVRESRPKGELDFITSFVMYVITTLTLTSEKINIPKV